MTFLRVFLAILTPLHSLTSLSLFLFIVLLIGFTVSNIKDIKVNMLVNIVKQFHSYPSIMKMNNIQSFCFRSHQNSVVPSLFSGKETHVSALPFNIDGDQVYKLSYYASNPALSTSDGRPWNPYFNSKRGGFSGIRRHALCKGSPRCPNEMCWFKRPYGKENRVNFEERNGIKVCHSCNTEAEDIPCPAVKVWEVSEDKKWVTVYHHDNHTCEPVKKMCQRRSGKRQQQPFKRVTSNMLMIRSSLL